MQDSVAEFHGLLPNAPDAIWQPVIGVYVMASAVVTMSEVTVKEYTTLGAVEHTLGDVEGPDT